MIDREIRHHDNSSGVAGVIFGIMAILFGAPGILLGLVGFFFSLNQNKKAKNSWSKWGIVLNVVGFVLGIIFAVYISVYVRNAVAGLKGISG